MQVNQVFTISTSLLTPHTRDLQMTFTNIQARSADTVNAIAVTVASTEYAARWKEHREYWRLQPSDTRHQVLLVDTSGQISVFRARIRFRDPLQVSKLCTDLSIPLDFPTSRPPALQTARVELPEHVRVLEHAICVHELLSC